MTDPVADQLTDILAVRQDFRQIFDGLGCFSLGHKIRQPGEDFLTGRSQKIQYLRGIYRTVPSGDALVQDAEPVPDGPVGVARDDPKGRIGDIDADITADPSHPLDQDHLRHPLEIQAQAPGKNGGRQLPGLRGRQYESDIFRRFLQSLEEGIESLRRKHVDFVDDVDLVPSCRGGIIDTVPQLADIIDAPVGRGVDLDHIQKGPVLDCLAGLADPAGTLALRKAVQSLGQQPGGGRLAGPPGPAEQVGVAGRAGSDLVFQDSDNVFLAEKLFEYFRPVRTVQRCIHRFISSLL